MILPVAGAGLPGSTTGRPVLSFQNVSFGYPPDRALVLEALSLEIESGSITAVLGPNGVGKSTLLYLALGWLKPAGGRVLLGERELTAYTLRERGRRMSLVPQKEHFNFEFSLLEYVLLGRAPYLQPLETPGAADYRVAEQALGQVGLAGLMHRSVTRLSSGERQLVLLARALTQQPQLLLLDEPTSHLDLLNKSRLIETLRGLVAGGVTLLLTTHEPEVVSALATRAVLLRSGRILHAGSLDDCLTEDRLSDTYGLKVRVVEVDGRKVVLWT